MKQESTALSIYCDNILTSSDVRRYSPSFDWSEEYPTIDTIVYLYAVRVVKYVDIAVLKFEISPLKPYSGCQLIGRLKNIGL